MNERLIFYTWSLVALCLVIGLLLSYTVFVDNEAHTDFTLTEVLPVSSAFFAAAFLIAKWKKLSFSSKQITSMIFVGISFCFMSLLYSVRLSQGTLLNQKFGWPHVFYFFQDIRSYQRGPLWGHFNFEYFISNVIFYFSTIFFIYAIIKKQHEV